MKDIISRDSFYKSLYKAVLNKNINSILELCYSIWGLPISVIDIRYNLLGMYPTTNISEPLFDKILKIGTITDKERESFLEGQYLKDIYKHNEPYVLDWGVAKSVHRYVNGLQNNGIIYGVISMLLMNDYTMTEEDKRIYMEVSSACTEILSQFSGISRIHNSSEGFVLYSLLTGAEIGKDSLQNYISSANGFLESKYFRLLRIDGDSLNSPFYMNDVQRTIRNAFPELSVIIVDDRLYILLRGRTLDSVGKEMVEKVSALLFKNDSFIVYESDVFNDISKLSIYKDKVDFLNEFDHRKSMSNRIMEYDKYSPFHNVSFIPDKLQKEFLRNSPISILEYHDKMYGSEYFNTLFCFFKNVRDCQRTCSELNIHRNTLLNRISRIEQITNLSLSDCDDEHEFRQYLLIRYYQNNQEQ